ncbi:nucleotide sugar dehydrogenase [Streptomyces kronopolitis]|uniref:nucleotide sugar dehydrogenase n=1 Tax=Streptomyces kronopolitis TaxID=1612435 RepID=UPI0036BE1653
MITVPTPLRDGVPDLTCIETCARTVGEHLRPGATVILESTTYPGCTEELLVPFLEKASGLRAGGDFLAGFSPERIAPGIKRWSFEGTPKVVSGIDAKSLYAIKGFYDGIFQTTVPVSGPKVAELAKLLENTFRLVNISLVYELAMLAEPLGMNVWEAIDAAATKPFGFTRFTPGPGVGAHCLPVDPLFLSWKVEQELGVPFLFVDLADGVNRSTPHYVVQRIVASLDKRGRPIKGSRILLLGLTYKYNATVLSGGHSVLWSLWPRTVPTVDLGALPSIWPRRLGSREAQRLRQSHNLGAQPHRHPSSNPYNIDRGGCICYRRVTKGWVYSLQALRGGRREQLIVGRLPLLPLGSVVHRPHSMTKFSENLPIADAEDPPPRYQNTLRFAAFPVQRDFLEQAIFQADLGFTHPHPLADPVHVNTYTLVNPVSNSRTSSSIWTGMSEYLFTFDHVM